MSADASFSDKKINEPELVKVGQVRTDFAGDGLRSAPRRGRDDTWMPSTFAIQVAVTKPPPWSAMRSNASIPPPRGASTPTADSCSPAYTAAGQHHSDEAIAFLNEARAVAARLPEHWPITFTFGTPQIAMYEIGVHNTLGNSTAALAVTRHIPGRTFPTPATRVRVHIDTARAWQLQGDRAKSTNALIAADGCADQEMHRPSNRALVTAMLAGPGRTPPGLVRRARRIGAE